MRADSTRDARYFALAAVIVIAFSIVSEVHAQVPKEIAAQLREIGTGVCVPETAKLYRPLQPAGSITK